MQKHRNSKFSLKGKHVIKMRIFDWNNFRQPLVKQLLEVVEIWIKH